MEGVIEEKPVKDMALTLRIRVRLLLSLTRRFSIMQLEERPTRSVSSSRTDVRGSLCRTWKPRGIGRASCSSGDRTNTLSKILLRARFQQFGGTQNWFASAGTLTLVVPFRPRRFRSARWTPVTLRKNDQCKHRKPIKPLTVLRLVKLWPHVRRHGREIGQVYRVGYYCRHCGLDIVWLVDRDGNYNWTADHEFLDRFFEILVRSRERSLYGRNRPEIGKLP